VVNRVRCRIAEAEFRGAFPPSCSDSADQFPILQGAPSDLGKVLLQCPYPSFYVIGKAGGCAVLSLDIGAGVYCVQPDIAPGQSIHL
jgi:hypothetical protein